ncbi:MAG: glycosyltransferase family 2 protein, partial [Desulfofustis sp.]|nr:glycosyltransferase family 2 protein [Desulfofustis sp.]
MLSLSIVIPTYNEAGNVQELLTRLEECLGKTGWEVIFVDDDSPDNTAGLVRDIAQRDHRVRCLQRIGRRGLASACIEGLLAGCGELLAVMDADLQHDERILPEMVALANQGDADIVIATRYAQGGSTGEWDWSRKKLSKIATFFSHAFIPYGVSDPMSGFFLMRREVFQAVVHDLSGIGYKILFDVLSAAKGNQVRIQEVPYRFRHRHSGESKLDLQVMWEFGILLADKLLGRFIPAHFISFALIGGLGVFVHLAIMGLLFKGLAVGFVGAHAFAAVLAMTFNYTLNNELTYRSKRLRH